MNIAASKLSGLGYVSTGVAIVWDSTSARKKITFRQCWQNTTHETYRDYFTPSDNGLAILTGDSNDLYVIDCDVLKADEEASDGVTVFREQLEKHGGLPEGVPVQRSGSGGMHYFFSLSKSFQNGLRSGTNQTKVRVDGVPTTIDTRGERGCILAEPSAYKVGTELKRYEWVTPLVARHELQSMPTWCITLLNQSKVSTTCSSAATTSLSHTYQAAIVKSIELFKHETIQLVEKRFNAHLQHIYDREYGYDGTFLEKKTCTLCQATHHANNYMVRQVVDSVFLIKNYSSKCRSGAYNWEDHRDIKGIIASPDADEHYAHLLREVMRARGFDIVCTEEEQYWMFNGHYWEETSKLVMARETRSVCGVVLEKLYTNIRVEPASAHDNPAVVEQKKALHGTIRQLQAGRGYLKKAANVKAIMACYQQLYVDREIARKLDTNKDILVVANGVVDLRTGELREGCPSDYTSVLVDTKYDPMLATNKIDAFFASIFNDEKDVIDYVQCLLGYAITGHTQEQVWCIFTGIGSNGKSLLMSIIAKLMGAAYCAAAPAEIFFKRNQRTQAGAATAHLQTLKATRICYKEETDPTEALNTELLKMVTGESIISSRGLYEKKFVNFESMAFPILLCNHKPDIDVDDYALLRRIIVIPFTNTYCSPDDPVNPYDKSNKQHRLRDNDLKRKLMTEECLSQLLTWLVRGAVKWYTSSGLPERPSLITDALEQYRDDNDTLGQFITERYDKDASYHVSASDFRMTYTVATSAKIKQTELADAMKRRGFRYGQHRVNDKTIRVYFGLRCKGGYQ